jgi:hypothetical protein
MMTFLKKKSKKPTPQPKTELLASEVDDSWNIKIASGDFAGVVFRFNRVRFVENDDRLRIAYEYDVLDSANISDEELTSPAFKSTIDSILELYLTEGPDGTN